MKIEISLPLSVEIGTRTIKSKTLNLNYYRNWNRFDEAKIKKAYSSIVIGLMQKYRFQQANIISLELVLYKGSNRRIDRSNILSIHEKYLCDALVEMRFIKDDNDKYITETIYRTGGVDKKNPRVDLVITVIS